MKGLRGMRNIRFRVNYRFLLYRKKNGGSQQDAGEQNESAHRNFVMRLLPIRNEQRACAPGKCGSVSQPV
ncbi:MAG TPA: hypothetical protein VFM25_13925 [Verrucomicrobiae bacterium]|nr:hypothetical protein [Verrucomicrobiae bacterium]